ncbi:uncharacterized protein L969DRAFT_85083 [Mixia osmundae IAM 14324]|uniref:Major facilitator superfamily (MFS) profile domain-containing protein n=1 Tax=Mixia osmundae (strain CBS 9802 / IAM 14324 / JCM 22182 / KY 12970) TaxID=764103 RepID=G7DXU6_MIXOS|nr:uncharacterized protein L969DRAFT_85083 [Mixia osmundae IAM 14324]KEI41309.1 hypothetical protein L969DRAFT_85083 [Mixia osmundae IAM 14324]GAA95406.1 hypothetical protein E5Q_02060 [Mixia osmundae IAM 14324]
MLRSDRASKQHGMSQPKPSAVQSTSHSSSQTATSDRDTVGNIPPVTPTSPNRPRFPDLHYTDSHFSHTHDDEDYRRHRGNSLKAPAPAPTGVDASAGADSSAEKGLLSHEYEDNIVVFESEDDPANPMNWSTTRKSLITALLGLTTFGSTFASSIFSSGTMYVGAEFGVSNEVATLGTALFILGYVFGPIAWSPISEVYGRRPAVLLPYGIFVCFSAATAVSKDLQSVFITRFFAGVFGSAPVSNVGGGLGDLWSQKYRGIAVVFYSFAVVGGPTLGPLCGSAVSESYLGWRWTEYLVVIAAGTIFLADVIWLPETFAPVLLSQKAQKLRLQTGRWELHSKHETVDHSIVGFLEKSLLTPLKLLTTEPYCLGVCLFNAFAYSILYALFEAVPIAFTEQRGWKPVPTATVFLAVLVGVLIAGIINIAYSVYVYAPKLDKAGGNLPPEARLPPMLLGSLLFPIGFFLFAWTSDPNISAAPQVIALVFIGCAFLLIFQNGINTLIDAYYKHAASAIAANTLTRSLGAAALAMATQPFFHNLGVNWAGTLLGCLAVLFAGVPLLLMKYGASLRARSHHAA